MAAPALFAVQTRLPLQPQPEELRRILTQFTNDALIEKPEDILEYMAVWAASHIKRSDDGVTAVETGGLVRLSTEMEQLQALMHKRINYYMDITDGCRYHYLLALEDSEGDIFQLQSLDRRVQQAKEATAVAQREQEEVNDQMEYYLTHLPTDDEKSAKIHQLFRRYKPVWSQDILVSPRSRINMFQEKINASGGGNTCAEAMCIGRTADLCGDSSSASLRWAAEYPGGSCTPSRTQENGPPLTAVEYLFCFFFIYLFIYPSFICIANLCKFLLSPLM
eukprot:gene3926-2794_t